MNAQRRHRELRDGADSIAYVCDHAGPLSLRGVQFGDHIGEEQVHTKQTLPRLEGRHLGVNALERYSTKLRVPATRTLIRNWRKLA
jgi:hypothetical protein